MHVPIWLFPVFGRESNTAWIKLLHPNTHTSVLQPKFNVKQTKNKIIGLHVWSLKSDMSFNNKTR